VSLGSQCTVEIRDFKEYLEIEKIALTEAPLEHKEVSDKINVTKMRMLRWMSGNILRDRAQNEQELSFLG